MERRTARTAATATALAIACALTGLVAGPAQAQTTSISTTTWIGDGRLAITPIPIPGSLLLPSGFRLPGGGIAPYAG